MGRFRARQTPAAAVLLALLLSGCGGFGGFPSFGNSASPQPTASEPEVAPEIPASIQSTSRRTAPVPKLLQKANAPIHLSSVRVPRAG
jgi:hypothetical protein